MAKSRTVIQKGDEFGLLTSTGNKKNIDRRWLGEFTCDCGATCYFRLDRVKKGKQGSCGCQSPNHDYKAKQKSLGAEYPFHVLLSRVRKRAAKAKIECSLTIEDLSLQYAQQNGKCAYSQMPIITPATFCEEGNPNNASVDRIDPHLGYIKTNIQLTTKNINRMKQCSSHDEFIARCRKVTEIHNSKMAT